MDDGFGFDPGHGAGHVSDRVAGHRNQDHLGARNIAPVRGQSRTFTPGMAMYKYAVRRVRS